MSERYWLIYPNGGRQLIDPRQFDIVGLAAKARLVGGRLVVENETVEARTESANHVAPPPRSKPHFRLDASSRQSPRSARSFGRGSSASMSVWWPMSSKSTRGRPRECSAGTTSHADLCDSIHTTASTAAGSLEELFDTFLHEIAHHIEYTEPDSFHARECQRVHGRMHSPLFWRILGDLKYRWAELQLSDEIGPGVPRRFLEEGRGHGHALAIRCGIAQSSLLGRQAQGLDLGDDVVRCVGGVDFLVDLLEVTRSCRYRTSNGSAMPRVVETP